VSNKQKDLYKVLGIERTASKADIQSSYRKLAKKHHPDKSNESAEFLLIKDAYDVLIDEAKRKFYDLYGDITTDITIINEAKSLILQIFSGIYSNITNQKFTNIVNMISNHIEKTRVSSEAEYSALKDRIDLYSDIHGRLNTDVIEDSFMHENIKNEINYIEIRMLQIRRIWDVVRVAKRILSKYSYTTDKVESENNKTDLISISKLFNYS